jgi:hypothetical protein
MFTGTP